MFNGCTLIGPRTVWLADGSAVSSGQFKVLFGGWEWALNAEGTRTTRDPWTALLQSSHFYPR